MSEGLLFAAVAMAALVWMLLPAIPAMRELVRPADADALTQVGQDAGDLAIFAQGFRRYLERELPPGVTTGQGQLRDGTPLLQLDGDAELLKRVATPDGAIGRLVVANYALALPGREIFLYELLAKGRFVGGPEAVYRAILTEGDAELGERSRVLRWLHVEGDALLRDGVVLEGRGSATGTMWLTDGVRFTRIRASRIVAGRTSPAPPTALPAVLSSTMRLPRTARQLRGFIRVEGDLDIPPGESLAGTVVVYGDVRVGARARLAGSVKSHGNCTLGAGAIVDGSVVGRGDVHIGDGARVGGPLVAEGEAVIERGATIGTADSPTSVTALRITMRDAVQVFGAVSARTEGVVTS